MANSKQDLRTGLRAKCEVAVGEKNSSQSQDAGRSKKGFPSGEKSSNKHGGKLWKGSTRGKEDFWENVEFGKEKGPGSVKGIRKESICWGKELHY